MVTICLIWSVLIYIAPLHLFCNDYQVRVGKVMQRIWIINILFCSRILWLYQSWTHWSLWNVAVILKGMTFRQILWNIIFHWEIAFRWLPQNLTNESSTLAQVIAWCRQATSHYMSQSWPICKLLYDVSRPHWVKLLGIHIRFIKDKKLFECKLYIAECMYQYMSVHFKSCWTYILRCCWISSLSDELKSLFHICKPYWLCEDMEGGHCSQIQSCVKNMTAQCKSSAVECLLYGWQFGP